MNDTFKNIFSIAEDRCVCNIYMINTFKGSDVRQPSDAIGFCNWFVNFGISVAAETRTQEINRLSIKKRISKSQKKTFLSENKGHLKLKWKIGTIKLKYLRAGIQ